MEISPIDKTMQKYDIDTQKSPLTKKKKDTQKEQTKKTKGNYIGQFS